MMSSLPEIPLDSLDDVLSDLIDRVAIDFFGGRFNNLSDVLRSHSIWSMDHVLDDGIQDLLNVLDSKRGRLSEDTRN